MRIGWCSTLLGSMILLLGVASCDQTPKRMGTYSLPPGQIDSPERAAATDPGFVFDYGEAASKTAHNLLAEYARAFTIRRFAGNEPDYYEFLSSPHATGNFGLCKVQTLTIWPEKSPDGKHPDWTVNGSERYAVIGSLAPLPGGWNDTYGRRLEQACSLRRDIQRWFSAQSANDAAHAAAILDIVVTAARSKATLPFALQCVPASENDEVPACVEARATVAKLDARAIDLVETKPCPSQKESSFCGTIEIARQQTPFPSDRSDEWALRVTADFDGSGSKTLEIGSVQIRHVQRTY